jgi:hypothetical protein
MNRSDIENLAAEIGKVVAQKNEHYGDSFFRAHEVLNIIYPDGISPTQYPDFLAVTRIVDKLFRLAQSSPDDKESPGFDIAGYGLLIELKHRKEKEGLA